MVRANAILEPAHGHEVREEREHSEVAPALIEQRHGRESDERVRTVGNFLALQAPPSIDC